MVLAAWKGQRLKESAETLSDPDDGLWVTFTDFGDEVPRTTIRYSFDLPAGEYLTRPLPVPVLDPSLSPLEATLSAWREVGIEPMVTGRAISNSFDRKVRRTWTVEPQVVETEDRQQPAHGTQ